MVCNRCISAVQGELLKLDLHPINVQMGIVNLQEDKLDEDKLLILNKNLNLLGFELLDKGKTRVIEQIKNLIIERIFHSEFLEQKVNWSELIADKVIHEYS